MSQIVVVGSINADLAVRATEHPQPGETVMGSGGDTTPGGKGANQAVAAALFGGNVTMVGAVGRDPYAEIALRRLTSSSVDLDCVSRDQPRTGLAVITVNDAGENTIVVVPGANESMSRERVLKDRALIERADIVLLQGEIPAEGTEAAIACATGRVVINLAPVIELDLDLLRQADPLIVNEHEAGGVLEMFGIESVGEIPWVQLLELGFRSVIVTLGSHGSVVATSEGIEKIPAVPAEVIDTTGAGDCFCGVFVAELAAGNTLVEAASIASAAAAISVQRMGAQDSYPLREEVEN